MTPCLWACLFKFRGGLHTYAQKHRSIDWFFFPPWWTRFPECKPGNTSFHRHCRCGWFDAGAPTHPSGGTDVATDSLCKHLSQSLHLWQLTVKNCEQLQSKKHRVKSQSRCKARYCNNPENWQMESIWYKLRQIYLSRRKKKKERRQTAVHQGLRAQPTVTALWCLTRLLPH